ncbi:uncharacterized protein MEPE_04613 [Melanopsichium pennsylvanicum]|uniref:G-protein coupled receptors family 1 profile domain-containing protein n=1 Tax=Melanopsichium pennsylvanicum TaxID=63383 RepID=A0AAJ5C6W8_9BASI|nr:uncharacterized protein MEPE_04613 [Melanopsichium pennsylvanicum]
MSATSMMTSSLYQSHPWWSRYDDPSVRVIAADNNTNDTATFQRESVGTTGNTVDMVICSLSFAGSIAIILPYVLNRRSRKLRHALILGLATSDLVTSIVIIITTACLIAQINLVHHEHPCTILGYILVSSIFSQHLWNLSIAIVTYMILVHPLSNFTLTVEKRVRWLWPVFWVVSFAINAISFGLGGFGFRGGYCVFTTGFYFTSIFQFVPRAIVFTVILCLYTHLFFFLRRTNLFSRANHSNSINLARHRSTTHNQTQSTKHHDLNPPHNQAGQPLLDTTPFTHVLATSATDSALASKANGSSATSSAAARSSKTSSGSRVTPVLNQNDPNSAIASDRRSSSLVEKDGLAQMSTFEPWRKYSDPTDRQPETLLSGVVTHSSNTHDPSTPTPRATYGLLDPNYSMAPRRRMPSELDIETANNLDQQYDGSSISPHSPGASSAGGTAGGAATLSNQGSSAPLNSSFPRGSGDESIHPLRLHTNRRPFTAEEARSHTQSNNVNSNNSTDTTSTVTIGNSDHDQQQQQQLRLQVQLQRRASLPNTRYNYDSDSSLDLDVDHPKSHRRMRPRKDAGDFSMMTPPVEHLKHYTTPGQMRYAKMADILAMGDDEMARARAGNVGTEPVRRGSAVQILPGEVVVEMPTKEAFEQSLGDDWVWGMDVTCQDESHRNYHSSRRIGGNNSTATKENNEAGLNTGTSSTSSGDEHGVDSIGSTLNRQASLLLLLYPAAYCLLFSISIARLSVDLADPGASIKNANDWLHSLSRWLIFAQGAIDALIFQFVERQFRQRMKRRRRKAMGEQVKDSLTGKMTKGVKKCWKQQQQQQQSCGRNASAIASVIGIGSKRAQGDENEMVGTGDMNSKVQ